MIASVRGVPLLSGFEQAVVPEGDWEELAACPLCGRDVREVGAVDSEGAPGARMAACEFCGHVFMRRRPSEAWFDDYYARGWDQQGQSDVAAGARTPKPARKVLDACAAAIGEQARVLEVGAGFGSQLLGFREAGHEVAALERSEHRARFIESLGIPVTTGPFERAELPVGFDLVFSHHVLEHVADPNAVIAKQASLLREGGVMYVAVPSLWAEHPPQALHFAGHLSQFTAASLHGLLRRHGLEPFWSQEDRELQVLARSGGTQQAQAAGTNGFLGRLESWLLEGFGGAHGGRRVLVWRKARRPDAVFDAEALAPRAFAAKRLGAMLPGRRLDPSTRALDVEVSGTGLPVTVRHPGGAAPVWIK